MHTHRFARKLKLPSTIAIKHQISKLMFDDSVKKAAAGARAEAIPVVEAVRLMTVITGHYRRARL